MDLHTAGNHWDHRLSVTDGVCQHRSCSLCFHLAIKPIESRCCRDQCTIWRLPVGHHFQSLHVSISLNIPVNWSRHRLLSHENTNTNLITVTAGQHCIFKESFTGLLMNVSVCPITSSEASPVREWRR